LLCDHHQLPQLAELSPRQETAQPEQTLPEDGQKLKHLPEKA
jgi:hypothetical protein